MASIPENVRVLWPSSASTPSGWTTDTAFNDKMPYGANSGSGTGGNDTHGHPGNSHSHGGGGHSHSTGTLNKNTDAQPTSFYPYGYLFWYTPQTVNSARCACHTHSGGPVGSTSTGGSSGGTANYNSGNHLPAYYTFRVIKSDGTGDGFPAGSVVLWNTASNPTSESGWSQHGASAGKFIRAASNGGGTGGGSSHSHGSNSHTHGGGGGSHTHPAGSSPTSNTGVCTYVGKGGGGGGCEENIWNPSVPSSHTHGIPATSNVSAPGGANSAGAGSSGGATPEPPYYSVWGVTNCSDSWLEGGIAFISGESVPDDWVLCNGSNGTPNLNSSKYLKFSSSGGSVGGTGNSTSHNHSGPGGHGHPGGGSHSHNVPSNSAASNQVYGSANSWSRVTHNQYTVRAHQFVWPNYAHTHPLSSTSTSSNPIGSFSSGTSGISSGSHGTPAYKTVTWIMAPEEPSAGGNVGMFGANF